MAMARIEWVKHRLDNWALWHERSRSGGLGFATQSAFLNDVAGRGESPGAKVPVDEVDAALTDQAVEALKLGHGHLHQTLRLIYLKGVGIKQAARTMQRAESTIKAQLERADHLLAQWFADRQKRQAEAKAEFDRKYDQQRGKLSSFTP